ncbi:hypothetical protein C8R44DRAFT_753079 [Mycena epipterygia]|nr:hypothetical protein C8R44DRAFT_753079 [Mycena epipterygia]
MSVSVYLGPPRPRSSIIVIPPIRSSSVSSLPAETSVETKPFQIAPHHYQRFIAAYQLNIYYPSAHKRMCLRFVCSMSSLLSAMHALAFDLGVAPGMTHINVPRLTGPNWLCRGLEAYRTRTPHTLDQLVSLRKAVFNGPGEFVVACNECGNPKCGREQQRNDLYDEDRDLWKRRVTIVAPPCVKRFIGLGAFLRPKSATPLNSLRLSYRAMVDDEVKWLGGRLEYLIASSRFSQEAEWRWHQIEGCVSFVGLSSRS